MVLRTLLLALPPHAVGERETQHGGTENDGQQCKKIFHDMLLP